MRSESGSSSKQGWTIRVIELGAQKREHVLGFLRRPAIGLCAGTAHQSRPLTVAQAVCLHEGLDGLLVIDNSERTRPVGAPQAAIQTPGVEDASKGIPDIGE